MNVGEIYTSNYTGDAVISEILPNYKAKVIFILTGTEKVFIRSNIKRGEFKDKFYPSVCGVGYMGEGKYKSSYENKKCKCYTTWVHMLDRCYSDRKEDQGRYKDYTVCTEWHNYQNFAKWFEDTYPQDGRSYELDKDNKQDDSKQYSPDTCTWLMKEENASLSASYGETYWLFKNTLTGEVREVYNLSKFAREIGVYDSATSRAIRGKRKSSLNGWVFTERLDKGYIPSVKERENF